MIDAHQHFWRIGHNDCAWPHRDLNVIYRDFGPGDLTRMARTLGIEGSILVQSQPSDRDTDYLLALAADEPFVQAVVGWVDMASPGAPARIADLALRPKFRGLRPMLQSLPQADWILLPEVESAVAAMVEHGLSLDLLIQPRHLPHMPELAGRHPALPMVIDHGAKPAIQRGEIADWREQMAALAALPNVHCKLSGLLTECAPGQGETELRPYVEALLKMFGPERLMWGSDWPVIDLASDYGRWLKMAQDMVAEDGKDAVSWVFAGSARRFYRL